MAIKKMMQLNDMNESNGLLPAYFRLGVDCKPANAIEYENGNVEIDFGPCGWCGMGRYGVLITKEDFQKGEIPLWGSCDYCGNV